MGHHQSRPQASHGDASVTPEVSSDATSMYLGRRGRQASSGSHWWSSNKSKSSSKPQPEPAQLTTVNRTASEIQLQIAKARVAAFLERPWNGIDSPQPPEILDEHPRGSDIPERAQEASDIPYVQTLEEATAACVQTPEGPTTPFVQTKESSSAQTHVTLCVAETIHTLSDVLGDTKPQAASSSTRHDLETSFGRRFPLLVSHCQPPPEVTTELDRDHLVALQTSRDLKSEEERLVAQTASDHLMAFCLQAEEERSHAAEPRPPSRDCQVCCESFHPLTFPAKPPSSECAHLAEVCFPCLQQWVATKVETNARAAIDCPQCTTLLTHEDVRRACNFETFAKYDKFAALTVVDGMKDFQWCLGPGCTSGQEHISTVLGYMKCHACSYEQCLQHKTAWHHGESCKTYDLRAKNQAEKQVREREERESTKFMDEQQITVRLRECPNTKCKNRIADDQEIPERCPKPRCNTSLEREPIWKKCPTCQTLIEKIDGCDQMKCRVGTMNTPDICSMPHGAWTNDMPT
jgi:hypothetical protein